MAGCRLAATQDVKVVEYGVEGGQNVGFDAADRRQGNPRQALLQGSQVVVAQGHVAQQVAGAGPALFGELIDPIAVGFGTAHDVFAQRFQFLDQAVESLVVCVRGKRSGHVDLPVLTLYSAGRIFHDLRRSDVSRDNGCSVPRRD